MLVECNICEAKVDAKILAENQETDEYDEMYKISFVVCPVCKQAMVTLQELIMVRDVDMEWDNPIRMWPSPRKYLDYRLPELVKSSLEEAHECYKAKVYNSCAVMCRRAIEAICTEFKTKSKTLVGGLNELLKMQIIDKKIFEWAEALRLHGNIGAHASKEKITKEEANDLLEFTDAICNYVFVLSKKFEEFLKRKEKQKEK
jgi:hypothetical protein